MSRLERSTTRLEASVPSTRNAQTKACSGHSCTRMCRIEDALESNFLCTLTTPQKIAVGMVEQEALALVSKEEGLFVVQPPAKQWENLAFHLDQCMILADRSDSSIFVGWYAHTQKSRISGVRVQPTQATAEDDTTWNKAVK